LTFKFYVAGIYTANFDVGGNLWNRLTDLEKEQRISVDNKLESYHYINRQSAVDKLRKDEQKVFLDSGAFSAFTKGVEINMRGYCEYIQRNEDIIEKVDGTLMASVLDGIGDPLKTWQNQLAMESLGVRPLPCFHYGEDERYLEWYVANYEYITLGGMVAQSDTQLYFWLDRIWDEYLTDGSGRAKLKVHGFGVSTAKLMRRYPWYSTDSSSWVQSAATGSILILPDEKMINVSNQSPSRKMEGQHITTLTPPLRKAVEDKLTLTGIDLSRMSETYLSRWCYNMAAFSHLGRIIDSEKGPDPRFIRPQPGLF